MVGESRVRKRFELLTPLLDERLRRLVTAAEAAAIGYGGVSAVARATGVSRRTIHAGLEELHTTNPEQPTTPLRRVRRPGGGRKKTVDKDPMLRSSLDGLVDPVTRGNPEGPLRWTCKSVRRLAHELLAMDHSTSHRMVAKLLREAGYSLQANRKNLPGAGYAARNSQFHYLNERAHEVLAAGDPVAFVDIRRSKTSNAFTRGKSDSWISVGVDAELAELVATTIRRWWCSVVLRTHPEARHLLIAADCAGRDSSAAEPWRMELQRLADDFGLPVTVCHLPPGTIKWIRIEDGLCAAVTESRRGQPPVHHEVIVHRVAAASATPECKGSHQSASAVGPGAKPAGGREKAGLRLGRHDFHGDWNYTLFPV